jgi:2,3-bisphosphoglycerate-dependent phosphoglycerate mutase
VETTIYFVRYGESMFVEGQERSRGLSDKGKLDAINVKEILAAENIEHFISSPYTRAIETIYPAAKSCKEEIKLEEDLKERVVGDFSPLSFMEAKQKLFENYQDAFPEGESSMGAQDRAIKVILKTLKKYEGKKIVIGTHGDIITLIMNYFDKQYGYQFWQTTTMLDIYKLIFKDRKIISMTRL